MLRKFNHCLLWILLLFVLISTSALALQNDVYHLKLLAVQDNGENYTGSTADLYLELIPGHSRVFLDTFPLTKMDTQVSTRFAKEIACKHFQLDCENYDFIYTIKSGSSIIGGPSAGAAISALTAIAMLDLNYNQDITITATINSGGTIGPVGGVKEKLEAASKAGLKKIMISKGSSKIKFSHSPDQTEEENGKEEMSYDLIEYSKNNLSLEVVEVMDIDEVVYQLTGKKINQEQKEITKNLEYQEIMQRLQKSLCNRTKIIRKRIKSSNIKLSKETLNISLENDFNFQLAMNETNYYSAASFCFSNNIILKKEYYLQSKLPRKKFIDQFKVLESKINLLEKLLANQEISTISSLQAMMIVKERLNDVKEQVKEFNTKKETLNNEELSSLLSYVEERYYSVLSWKEFLDMSGKRFILKKENLYNSCLQKISEADERYQYASIFLGQLAVFNIQDKIELAKESSQKEEYELCLIKAIQAKAEANAILSSLGVTEDVFSEFIDSKINAVEKVISENSIEGTFPIMGYSYYQYAKSLTETQKYTALIYLEYALEMSDLSIYFPEEGKDNNSNIFVFFNTNRDILFLLEGFIAGVLLTLIIFMVEKQWIKNKNKHKINIKKVSKKKTK